MTWVGFHALRHTAASCGTAATWAVPMFVGIVAAWFAIGWVRGLAVERRRALTALLAGSGPLLINQTLILGSPSRETSQRARRGLSIPLLYDSA